ncbi:MAG: ribonucleoside triphosphate reductase [Methanophagales archaeon]|nr:ribonucleoside triphosphate reductase [Methanophagales archaeon]
MKDSVFTSIKKRDGRVELFEAEKITNAIWKAGAATGEFDYKIAQKLTLKVLNLAQQAIPREIPTVEEIQDVVEEVLLSSPYRKTAKAYIIYREQHAGIREITAKADVDLVDQYLEKIDWQVNENSNMSFSLQGLNNYVSSEISKIYWMIKIYPSEVRKAHSNGDFHIHDLNLLSVYCVGWDLFDLLVEGFKGAQGKIESKPAKHLRSALGQIVNFFYTLQGEAAGAQAFSNFDTLLAPFIRYDGLGYKEVKQALQEFVFNINVPTRVGFQCMSEDTEILGENGWKRYNQVKEGDVIATFNIEKGFIEYLPVRHVFAREYRGMMYNLKNRISDQLISPEHRVVRRRFGAEGYTLEKIEKVYDLKSPFMIPVGSEGKMQGNNWVDKDVIKLIAWVIAEGTIDRSGRGSGRISIYQSKGENRKNYDEILSLCSSLKLKYTERAQKGLGNCNVIRFDADSTRKILQYFKTNKNKFRGIKFIPDTIINADAETARLFLETYIKGDGHDGCKITNTSAVIKDGLMQVIVNAGYGATVLTRKPDNAVSKKDRYIIRIIRHKDTYINTVKKVNYSGVIWCPNTDNETVIARRNGKIFITGNTPFTNITLDLTVPEYYAGQGVIIGGEIQKETYREFQEEMELFNKAFLEVMAEGDAKGRVFTFPIPTYNITKDFDWGNPNLDVLWQVTAKYGVPYFSNFINSDMNPEDARSMCCRLRIDNRELKKRGGGLFGSSPLTGSIGVVTLNMPRLGYLAKDEDEFISALERLMVLAKESLEVKRKVLEKFTEESLYPYTRYYLRGVKERFGEYWKNHFSTIGLVGMNEACLNMFGENIASKKSREFTSKVLDFMRGELLKFQAETGNNYNLEATPAEGTSYRLAKKDKEKYPKIICANEEEWKKDAEPFYTNSTQLPVNYTEDVFEALDLQDAIQTKYTGGTVFHVFAGERVEDPTTVKVLVRRICELYHLPYFTFTPTFSVCPTHGYLAGERYTCPECGAETEVYSRVVGYLRPVTQWNKGKREEFKKRKTFVVEAEAETVQKLKQRRKRKADIAIALKPPRIAGYKQLNLIDFGGGMDKEGDLIRC